MQHMSRYVANSMHKKVKVTYNLEQREYKKKVKATYNLE
jgi:hypothetical protein